MVKKLHIRENVVSDMYALKIINMDDVKNHLQGYLYNQVNLNTCSLIPIDKPRTYAVAKKSEYPILGVADNQSKYVGWDKPYKKGAAVMGIYGNGWFDALHGDDRIRTNFDSCDKFYQVVPDDVDTYKSKTDISQNRTHTVPVKLDDAGNTQSDSYYTKRNTLHKSRDFTDYDLDAYNPETNRKRYINILTKNHLNKFVSAYNNACTTIKDFQNRLNNVDITTVSEYNYGYALDAFKELISALKSINNDIKSIDGTNPNAWHVVTEADIDNDIKRFHEAEDKLSRRLDYLEN